MQVFFAMLHKIFFNMKHLYFLHKKMFNLKIYTLLGYVHLDKTFDNFINFCNYAIEIQFFV